MEVERWDGLEEIQEPYLCGGLSICLHVRVQCKFEGAMQTHTSAHARRKR